MMKRELVRLGTGVSGLNVMTASLVIAAIGPTQVPASAKRVMMSTPSWCV